MHNVPRKGGIEGKNIQSAQGMFCLIVKAKPA
jgi:hypothetical protein